MNDHDILHISSLTQSKIAELLGESKQNVSKCVLGPNTYFTLDRLQLLYEHLRRIGNAEALARLTPVIDQQLLHRERPLAAYLTEPWRHLTAVLPGAEWTTPMLRLIAEDRRPSAYSRRLDLLVPTGRGRGLDAICPAHLPGRYQLRIHETDLPRLTPPLLSLNRPEPVGNLLVPGSDGFLALPERVSALQGPEVSRLLAEARETKRLDIDTQFAGLRSPGAATSDHCRVAFSQQGAPTHVLEMERLSEASWNCRLRALPSARPAEVRICDASGRTWVHAAAGYLPWQGEWPLDGDPADYWDELSLQVIETD